MTSSDTETTILRNQMVLDDMTSSDTVTSILRNQMVLDDMTGSDRDRHTEKPNG